MKEQTEMLDLLEKMIVEDTEQFLNKLGLPKKIDSKMAENLVAKIGTRIMFRKDLGEKRVDEIITKSSK